MKKIKVQSRISPIAFVIICISGITLLVSLLFLISADLSTTSSRIKYDFWCLVGIVCTLVGFGFKEVLKTDVYVAEFVFVNGSMQIVYKKRDKVVNVKTIDLSDITKFSVEANMKYLYLTKGRSLNVTYTVVINSKTHGLDTFIVQPSMFTLGCAYQFLLDLISVSRYIPNFSYTVNSEDEEHKKDIDYFKVNGKRLPLRMRRGAPIIIFLYIFLGSSFFMLGISIFSMFTLVSGMSPEKDSYIQNFVDIDDMRNKGNYKGAIERVEYLKTIEPNDYNVYLYEAYIYEVQGQYEKEIDSANKALVLIQSNAKSKWDETFFKDNIFSKTFFKSSNDKYTRTYDRLATANFQLKKYKEAENFYTKELEYNTYKFPDAYFYRGVCRYYLGNKQGALEDFFKQKEIYDEYFAEFEGGGQYDKNDYDLLNRWIEACKR